MEKAQEMTGEEIVERMDPNARAEAEKELAEVEPAGSEPFHIGAPQTPTELDEDPISEGGSSREGRL